MMKKALAIATIALCILILVSVVPVSAEVIEPKPPGDGISPVKVKPPSEKDVAAAIGIASAVKKKPTVTITETPSFPTLKTPKLVSPEDNIYMYHYPRTTVLQWEPVDGATGYLVERGWYDTSWHFYDPVTVEGNTNTFYMFVFVGDQPGCWRVTALGDSNNANSNPSNFRVFYYSTGLKLSTPEIIAPVNNSVFSNYPRLTQLAWKPVPGATGYETEVSYGGWGPWESWRTNTVENVLRSYDTFYFVGAQPGRARVRAIDITGNLFNSSYSEWRYFSYTN